MSRDLIPRNIAEGAWREAELRAAAERQLVAGETVEFAAALGKQHVAITDRRVLITTVGSWLGERAESIPLGAITGLATTVRKEKIMVVQLAVPGRTWGELILTGDDLGAIHAALVRCLPVVRSQVQ